MHAHNMIQTISVVNLHDQVNTIATQNPLPHQAQHMQQVQEVFNQLCHILFLFSLCRSVAFLAFSCVPLTSWRHAQVSKALHR